MCVGKSCRCVDPYAGLKKCGTCGEYFIEREGHVCDIEEETEKGISDSLKGGRI
jgi:hypothetical protein